MKPSRSNALNAVLLRDTLVNGQPILKGTVIAVNINMLNYLEKVGAAREYIADESPKEEVNQVEAKKEPIQTKKTVTKQARKK